MLSIYYASETGKPVDVNVRLAKVNPVLEIVYYGTVNMEKKGDEKTAVRFKIGRDGEVFGINFLPKSLVVLG